MYRLTVICLRYRLATCALTLAVTIALGIGTIWIRHAYGYRVLIGDHHPTIESLETFIAEFSGGLPIKIAWKCVDGGACTSVFDDSSLMAAHGIAEALRSHPDVRSVVGPANAPILIATPDGFDVRRLVEDGRLADDRAALASKAMQDPFWPGTFVSSDGRAGAVLVQAVDNSPERDLRVFDAVQDATRAFEQNGLEFSFVGEAPAAIVAGRDLARSSSALLPVIVLVIATTLLIFARSWFDALVSLATMGIGLLWTMGLLGWLGWPRDGILEVLAPLILVVGVCDAIHLLSRRAELSEAVGRSSNVTLLAAARETGPPCLATTLTTAAALLSFTTSDLDTFVRFGFISAFGVLTCLLLTFTLLPCVVSLVGIESTRKVDASSWSRALEAISRAGEGRAAAILLVSFACLVVCGLGWATRLRVDNNWLESFGEHSSAVRWVRFVEESFGSSDTLEIEIRLPGTDLIYAHDTLQTVASFADRLETIEGLQRPLSVVTLIERVNRLLHGDDPEFGRIGETTGANAQLLELISLEGGDLLGAWVSLDRSRLRVSVQATDAPYSKRLDGNFLVREAARDLLPSAWEVRFSGEYAIEMDWIRDVQATQLRSFPTAFALVAALLALFFRSLAIGLAALVPTVLPVVVILGTMGWVGMSLDVGRAMISAVLIGIGVDDSIHLLHRYKQNREAGSDVSEAMRGALMHVGRAVVTTSIALAVGFLTLLGSAWQTIASFGFLVALGILAALAASLFVLPAIFFAFAGRD